MGRDQSATDRRWRTERAAGGLRDGGSVLFLGSHLGEPGDLLTDIADGAGAHRVLRGRGSPAAPYGTLAGLLATVTPADLAPLPQPQRAVLSGAPFGAAPPADYLTPAAVRVAVLNLVRTFA